MTKDKLMKSIGILISNKIKQRIRSGKVQPQTNKTNGKKTLNESGRLWRSITYKIKGNTIIVGTNVKYAKIHHFGGTIFPKKAKYLAIPLTPAAKVKSPRDWENTFIKKGIIFRNLDNGNVEALYALKKSVKIPARPYMFIDNKDKTLIQNQIIKFYESKIKQ